jgi:glycosyltransferase involved in cell wall biosynthesis
MTESTGIAAFYDAFDERLLSDYVVGNARLAAGIKHALRYIPPSARRILDIGCGIGWSTREFARHRPASRVTGIDLSPRLIDVATRLTLEPNVEYAVQDVLDEDWRPVGVFDAIILLDVYEHIPIARRPLFHRRLATLLDEHGVLVLACPTPEHQAYLRRYNPDGLQPVDEDVDEAVLTTAAAEMGARLAMFRPVKIWNPNDYAHAVIARPTAVLPSASGAEPSLTPPADRARLVEERLRLTVLGPRLIAPVRPGPLVCVATPELDTVSETFIRNHITRLPLAVCVVHGRPIMRDAQNRSLLSPAGLLTRIARRIGRELRGESHDSRSQLQRALARHLRQRGVAVVLAEYGVTAVELLEACRLARVPLVAHFHGFDAYQHGTIDADGGRSYRAVFAHATALVVVSTHMADQLVRLGAPAEKVQVIPYGVDARLFGPADPAAAPPAFLAVGRFVEKKAPHLVIMAMSRVLAECPGARLTMIGEGPLLPTCRQLATALGIAHAIDFRGARSQRVVAEHMRQARVFVQHSVTASDGDSEGTPNSILEAQVSGLPVVATRHTGIVDCVLEGQTGFLVEEEDVESMADRMITLAKDPHQAAALGRAARSIGLERFRLDQSLARLAEVLREAASRAG